MVLELKAFISYSTKDQSKAKLIKPMLEEFNIQCIMISDDISASSEWMETIISEIKSSDIFIPILSNNFKNSEWCPQEVGIAYYCKYYVKDKDLQIIPLWIDGTKPFGFLIEIQGKEFDRINLLNPIFEKHKDYTRKYVPKFIKELKNAHNYLTAEWIMKTLMPYYSSFDDSQVNELISNAINNNQCHYARLCRNEYLPKFIEINKSKIEGDKLEKIQSLLNGW